MILLNIHKLFQFFQWPLNSHRAHGGHVDLGLKLANTKTKPSLLCSWPVWMLRKRMIKRSYLGDFNCQQRGPCVEIWITSRSITPGVPHQRTSTLVHAVHDSHHPGKMWIWNEDDILVEIKWVLMRHASVLVTPCLPRPWDNVPMHFEPICDWSASLRHQVFVPRSNSFGSRAHPSSWIASDHQEMAGWCWMHLWVSDRIGVPAFWPQRILLFW